MATRKYTREMRMLLAVLGALAALSLAVGGLVPQRQAAAAALPPRPTLTPPAPTATLVPTPAPTTAPTATAAPPPPGPSDTAAPTAAPALPTATPPPEVLPEAGGAGGSAPVGLWAGGLALLAAGVGLWAWHRKECGA